MYDEVKSHLFSSFTIKSTAHLFILKMVLPHATWHFDVNI